MADDDSIPVPMDKYRGQRDLLKDSLAASAIRWNRLSVVRGIGFLASLILAILAWINLYDLSTVWWILAGVTFAGFAYVAVMHENLERQIAIDGCRLEIAEQNLNRYQRDWDKLPVPKVTVPDSFAGTANDLDLIGRNSLFQLIGNVRTRIGIRKLRDWIVEGAEIDEIGRRQEAIAELENQSSWRDRFFLHCFWVSRSEAGPAKLVKWSESPSWFESRGWVLWLSRIASSIVLIVISALIFGWLSGWLPLVLLAGAIATNFILSVFYAGSIHDIYNQVSSRHRDVAHYLKLFDLLRTYSTETSWFQELQTEIGSGDRDVGRAVRELGRLSGLSNLRRNGFGFLLFVALQILFFYDVHLLWFFERWKVHHREHIPVWFDALARWEVVAALSNLANEHPDWEFPRVFAPGDDEQKICAEGLGHPLLPNESRIDNNVSVGPQGTVLLVTGSNMSGKSTLLRSLGVNIVLAQMGSVVAARRFSAPRCHIETSMRIADSLASGVSFFMAELKRLKEIVLSAKSLAKDDSNVCFYLLDEILQGTNSTERHIAVCQVVRSLIDAGAIGAISTHDLDLATSAELEQACQSVHFRETFVMENGRKQMNFDYRMRPGVATTTNALELLRLVGLLEDQPGEEHRGD